MKQTIRRILALTVMMATLLSTTAMTIYADDQSGDGTYTVTISNGSDTGISIVGDVFYAYQIFNADNVTSYSVTEGFRGFFTGTLSGGDGSNTDYDFDDYLDDIKAYESAYGTSTTVGSADGENPTSGEVLTYNNALDNYNQLAGAYMNSYESNMYALAIQMRTYLNTEGEHNSGSVEYTASATGASNEDGTEYAVLSGLYSGYYFIFDAESTMNGIGIAASGGFMPLTTSSALSTTIEVKQSIPTMTKTIYHDDEEKWDVVGDSQIGDEVKFRIISTLPSNITDYIEDDQDALGNPINADGDITSGEYIYTLSDEMSTGLTYNNDVVIYTANGDVVDDIYYDVIPYSDQVDYDGFTIAFDAIEFLTDYPEEMTLITYYSATLNENAVVASDSDTNTATLEYSTNPSDGNYTGSIESTVFHYTFALDVNKVDESGNGLAGARFGLFDKEGYAIPLSKGEIDYETGVVSYYYDLDATVSDSDGGYITTETIALTDDGTAEGTPTDVTVTGKFVIYGLNDQTTYVLKEVAAPDGYNTTDQFDIYFTATYSALGSEITSLYDGSSYVYTSKDAVSGDWSSTSTIVNRLKIYLPETGGIGTVLFQVGGGALMLGAAAMLLINGRKKKEN